MTLKRDSDGREYLELRERQTKTRTGEDIRNVCKVAPRAWENGENPERCPVAAYKLFRSKRPKKYCDAEDPFYIAPVPTTPFPSSSERWFISQPVGVNKLCSIMSNMCRAAGVSEDKRLTNHSARKFLVQTLTRARIVDRDIMQVTGHKNVQTFQWQAQAVLVLKDPQTQLPNSPNFQPNSPNFQPNGPSFQPNSPNFQPYSPNFQPNSPNFVINSLGRQSTQTVNAAAHSTAGKMFTNCKIGTVIINNYFTTTTTGVGMSPPRKRARCIIVSDSDSSQNSQ